MLQRKLTPPALPAGIVARPRLDDLFNGLLAQHDALAVLAAAGSGKTVQTRMFAVRFGWPLAWLTLDPADRSGSRLLSYLAAALKTISPDSLVVVERALSTGLTLGEAAAMLAETLEDESFLVVLDNCETIVKSPEAATVLEAFLDYLPGNARAILVGRDEVDLALGRMMLQGRMARVADRELAMTAEEVRAVLAALGRGDEDVNLLVDWTRGWAAGVAFQGKALLATPTMESLQDQRPNDFTAYVSKEIFDRLPAEEQKFLLETSVLDGVTARGAVALCGARGHTLWRTIGTRHLPLTVSDDRTLIYHPCFRQFLVERLHAQWPDLGPELQRRHAHLLRDEGFYEEAVELLLNLQDLDLAADVAQQAVGPLFSRADWQRILRWCETLGRDRLWSRPLLQAALLRALTAVRRIEEAQRLIRELEQSGTLALVSESDPGGVVHVVAWAFQWKPTEALALLRNYYTSDYRAQGIRYELEAVSGDDPVLPPPGNSWCEAERFVSWGLLIQGRLNELLKMLPPEEEWPPRSYYGTPHPLWALVWRGELTRARDLWEQVPLEVRERAHRDHWHHLEAWLLLAEGNPQRAVDAALEATGHSYRTRFGWDPCFNVSAARAMLSLGNTEDALAILMDAVAQSRRSGQAAYAEWGETFLGLSLLKSRRLEDAQRILSQTVKTMTQAHRHLMLPFAAAYLSEAEWRLGHSEAAAAAADQAYDATRTMGSLFPLQWALEDVPDLLQREIGQPAASRPWVRLFATRPPARVRVSRRPVNSTETVVLQLQTFGPSPYLLVNGVPARLRRLKIFELLAYLALHPDGVDRQKLQHALFPEADQRRAGIYFRQIVHQFRVASGVGFSRNCDDKVAWPEHVRIDSSDLCFERALVEANAAERRERLDRLNEALDLLEGAYLQDSDLEWVDSRRFELAVLVEQARLEAATIALEVGEYELARARARDILEDDPYSEPAYQILIQLEAGAGTAAGVLHVYRRLRSTLADLGLAPDRTTQDLVQAIREGTWGTGPRLSD